jgi:c-di-GMP-binding flagellar brake protein YcgR
MAWFSNALDQRRFPRFKADLHAIASVVGDCEIVSLRVRCQSISEGGVSISGVEGLAVGDLVSLEMHVPVSKQAIWVDAIVRHDNDRFGLEFVSLSDEQRNILKRYCRLQREEKRRH